MMPADRSSPTLPPAVTPTPSPPSPRAYMGILVLATLLGVPAAFLAALLMGAVDGLQTLVWTDLPDEAGWSAPPAWYVLAVPTLGGLIVALSLKLPGHGGHPAWGDLALEPLPRSAW
jgi:H+/Cl- antiporter ClcA